MSEPKTTGCFLRSFRDALQMGKHVLKRSTQSDRNRRRFFFVILMIKLGYPIPQTRVVGGGSKGGEIVVGCDTISNNVNNGNR